jgi:hypothetical protein
MRAFVSTLLLVFVVSCSGGGGTRMNSQIHRGPMPEGGTWAGIWFTNWGEMSISTQGSSVVGEFCQEDRNRYGRLEGTANGDVLTLHWITNDVTMGGAQRQTEGSAIVQFSFVQAGENRGMHFEGTWGYDRSNADGGSLDGDRSARNSDQFLRGNYSVSCALRDSNEGGAPMSDDDVGDNPAPEGETSEEAGETETEGGGEDSLDNI